jgi:transposase
MSRVRVKLRRMTTAERGQIVQRVLVDGWSAAQAAATFRVGERQVMRWVAAYRRHGMASLREGAAVDGPALRRWLWQLRTRLARILARLDERGSSTGEEESARCIRLCRDGKDSPSQRRRQL